MAALGVIITGQIIGFKDNPGSGQDIKYNVASSFIF